MEDFGGLIWIALIWFAASFLSAKRKKQRAEQARRRAQRASQATLPAPSKPTPTDLAQETASAPPTTAGRRRVDPTQREGSALERMLRQFGAELEQLEGGQRGPMGRDTAVELPSAEEVEEREILDQPVRRVERTPVVRAPRRVVTRDAETEAVVRRRLVVAEEHSRALTLADHRAFDAKIRQAPAEVRSKKTRFSAKQIRQAIVWREILGPPLALRDVPSGVEERQ